MPVEHFKSNEAYRKNMAYRHMHGIPFTAEEVVVGGKEHAVKHSTSGPRAKIDARQRAKVRRGSSRPLSSLRRAEYMAVLSEKEKRAVPKSERGVPGKSGTGSYPMPDKAHARAAEAYAAKYHGKDSAFARRIRAKAHKLFKMGGKSKPLSHLRRAD